MDGKKKAIEALKQQIKATRAELGPERIRELEEMAKNMGKPSATPEGRPLPPGTVAYDRKTALAAFEMFLKNHGDPEEFKRRLLARLKKGDH